jgi:uncharacterized SAM-binding protein YcdF (DUF218 family)
MCDSSSRKGWQLSVFMTFARFCDFQTIIWLLWWESWCVGNIWAWYEYQPSCQMSLLSSCQQTCIDIMMFLLQIDEFLPADS